MTTKSNAERETIIRRTSRKAAAALSMRAGSLRVEPRAKKPSAPTSCGASS